MFPSSSSWPSERRLSRRTLLRICQNLPGFRCFFHATPIRIAFFAGTRPEAVKMALVVEALQQTEGLEPVLVVTAQHREMMD